MMALAIGACTLSCAQLKKVPGIGAIVSANEDLTPENEYYVGRSVATNLLSRAEYKYIESSDFQSGQLGKTTAYVNAVGNVLAAAAMGSPRKDDRPSPIAGWHFVIVDDETVNAFAASGGFILINKGLVKTAKTEDELAAVLAHEIAHVTLRHGVAAIKKANLTEAFSYLGAGAAQATLDEKDLAKVTGIFDDSVGDIVKTMVTSGYSRDFELAADALGRTFLATTGYDPQALARVLQRMEADGGEGGMLATHPAPRDRIEALGKPLAFAVDAAAAQRRDERHAAAFAR